MSVVTMLILWVNLEVEERLTASVAEKASIICALARVVLLCFSRSLGVQDQLKKFVEEREI